MKRLLLLLGLAAFVAAEGEPCACPHVLHRVCGSDGLTYSNPCRLNCAKINGKPDLVKVHDGPCEPDEVEDVCQECDDVDYEPVCGSDDKTYDNNCRLECASISSSPGVELKHEGMCRTEENSRQKKADELRHRCVCPKIYSPVCGTDGNTYPNLCVLYCHAAAVRGLKLHYHGPCQHPPHHHHPHHHHPHHHPHHHNEKEVEPCVCPHALHRVCGSDGETYSNPCTLNCAKHNGKPDLVKVHDGPCEPDEDEDVCQECDDVDYEPVCGSDDKTYDNNCRLECASISSSPGVELKHEGICRAEDKKIDKRSVELKKRCACPLDYSPVCGNDGRTYPNLCVLECHMNDDRGLKLRFYGPCYLPHLYPPTPHHYSHQRSEEEVDPCVCPHALHRVCGSDGETYSNPCTLNCAKHNGKPDLVKVHDGPCEPDEDEDVCQECDDVDYEPVCGTDDKTYDNNCRLECASISSSPGVELKHEGICRAEDKKIHKRSVELKKRCACHLNFSPVCGTDGHTYPNLCILKCHMRDVPGLKLLYHGRCHHHYYSSEKEADPCACPHALHRVCGSDGETYSNPCTLNCAKHNGKPDLVKVHDGPCEPDDDEDVCQECDDVAYEPVCGTDDKTYDNNCRLECASISSSPGVELKHEGVCRAEDKKIFKRSVELKKRCNCFRNYSPVCGTDGRTYANLCVLQCHMRDDPDLKLHYQGQCHRPHHYPPPPHHYPHHHHPHHHYRSEEEVDPCVCPHALHRVCGSDGVTYSNPCTLNCAKHNGKPDLVKVHDGPCEPDDDEDVCQECDDVDYEPVCGTDDKTYDNNCRLECASISSSPGVELKHEGVCRAEDKKIFKRSLESNRRCVCPKIYSPVCGTDGHTYPNLCVLQCHMREDPGLALKYNGKCIHPLEVPESVTKTLINAVEEYRSTPCNCPETKDPVCGIGGNIYLTYQNLCIFNCKKLTEDNGLKLEHNGECTIPELFSGVL